RAYSAKALPETSFILSMSRVRETSSKHVYDIKSDGCCMSVLWPLSEYRTNRFGLQLRISTSTNTIQACTIAYPSTTLKQRLKKESRRDSMLTSSIQAGDGAAGGQRDYLDRRVLSSGVVKSFEGCATLESSGIHQAEFVLCT